MNHYPYDAVLFDLDGVLTSTTALHAAAWRQTFEELLDEPFDPEHDYLAYVDGKRRDDGVRDFMRSVRWVEHLRDVGVHTAVVSSSANADAVLRAAGIGDLFELVVSGRDVVQLGLRGKPAPDAFLEAARCGTATTRSSSFTAVTCRTSGAAAMSSSAARPCCSGRSVTT